MGIFHNWGANWTWSGAKCFGLTSVAKTRGRGRVFSSHTEIDDSRFFPAALTHGRCSGAHSRRPVQGANFPETPRKHALPVVHRLGGHFFDRSLRPELCVPGIDDCLGGDGLSGVLRHGRAARVRVLPVLGFGQRAPPHGLHLRVPDGVPARVAVFGSALARGRFRVGGAGALRAGLVLAGVCLQEKPGQRHDGHFHDPAGPHVRAVAAELHPEDQFLPRRGWALLRALLHRGDQVQRRGGLLHGLADWPAQDDPTHQPRENLGGIRRRGGDFDGVLAGVGGAVG